MIAPDSVFLDLDETLIHAREAGRAIEPGLPAPLHYGPYLVWMRPDVREILELVRALHVPLYLCTVSERAYATGLSDLFQLGIPGHNILGLEHLLAAKAGIALKGVLIDDLEPEHEVARFKRQVLGIGVERYFRIPAFHGLPDPCSAQTLRALKKFLCG